MYLSEQKRPGSDVKYAKHVQINKLPSNLNYYRVLIGSFPRSIRGQTPTGRLNTKFFPLSLKWRKVLRI